MFNLLKKRSQLNDPIKDAQFDLMKEQSDNLESINQVIAQVSNLGVLLTKKDKNRAVKTVLDAVRQSFGWAYGSYWELEPKGKELLFYAESGTVNSEFSEVTQNASFEKGVGLSGRTWKEERLVFVTDLGEVQDCCRRISAQRAGVKSGVCLPIRMTGHIIGTMDFFTTETIELSAGRRQALESIAQIVSLVFERIVFTQEESYSLKCMKAVKDTFDSINKATSLDQVFSIALSEIRNAFNWDYASYWSYDVNQSALVFSQDSGSVSSEFKDVTLRSSFKKGVGLSGRAWLEDKMIFVQDLADVVDCSRAPAALAAGVKSGICFPIYAQGQFIGTMDFFSMEVLKPSEKLDHCLNNLQTLIMQTFDKLSKKELQVQAAQASNEIAQSINQAANMASSAQENSQQAYTVMQQLKQSAQEINSVVGLIQSIAGQTNLLALNATIEAAGAGEFGKGFAVVADEVKALAGKSGESAKSIQVQIQSIQDQTEKATAAIDDIIHMIGDISSVNNTVAAAVEEQNVIINELAS